MGGYVIGKEYGDISWNYFLKDIKDNEMEDTLGFSSADFDNIKVSIRNIRKMSEEEKKIVRRCISNKLKSFKIVEEDESIKALFSAHANYCVSRKTQKSKRVHNVLAYRYASKTPMTNRMIGRKIGKCKEEVDNDISEALDNLVILCTGLPAIIEGSINPYNLTELVIHNYKILKAFQEVNITELFPEEIENMVSTYRTMTETIMKSFHKALEVYTYFCINSTDRDIRRINMLCLRYLNDNKSIPYMCNKYNVVKSTVWNDCRLGIKRISELMF